MFDQPFVICPSFQMSEHLTLSVCNQSHKHTALNTSLENNPFWFPLSLQVSNQMTCLDYCRSLAISACAVSTHPLQSKQFQVSEHLTLSVCDQSHKHIAANTSLENNPFQFPLCLQVSNQTTCLDYWQIISYLCMCYIHLPTSQNKFQVSEPIVCNYWVGQKHITVGISPTKPDIYSSIYI